MFLKTKTAGVCNISERNDTITLENSFFTMTFCVYLSPLTAFTSQWPPIVFSNMKAVFNPLLGATWQFVYFLQGRLGRAEMLYEHIGSFCIV